MSDPFIGEIRMFAGSFAPLGWAFCNGQILSIAQNQALFSLLGTTYGGDGQTTFALPNLQSRVPIHVGRGAGLSQYSLGHEYGSEQHALFPNEMPAHSHPVNAVSTGGNQAEPTNGFPAVESTGTSLDYSNSAPDTTMNSQMIGNTGENQPQPFSIVQPVLCVNFIIALTGIYPPRS